MRDIDSNLLTIQDWQSTEGIVKLVVRDIRLRFDLFCEARAGLWPEFGIFGSDTPKFNATPHIPENERPFVAWDHWDGLVTLYDLSGPIFPPVQRIFSVCGYSGKVYVRCVSDAADPAQWANWNLVPDLPCVSGSRPSLYWLDISNTLMIFSVGEDGIYSATAGQSGIPSGAPPILVMDWPQPGFDTIAGIAAIGHNEIFVCGVDTSGPVNRLAIWRKWYLDSDPVLWPYTIYDNNFLPNTATYFDAVGMDDGSRLIFYQAATDGLTYVVRWQDGVWGTPKPLLPMDFVDTTSSLRIANVKKIGNLLWATGHIIRPGSVSGYEIEAEISMRSLDGEHWSLDRNCYIGEADLGGSLHVVDNHVYYVGNKSIYRAPSTWLIDPATDNPSKKYEISGFAGLGDASLEVPTADGAASTFGADLLKGQNVLFWPTTPVETWTWDDGHVWPDPISVGPYVGHPVIRDGAIAHLYLGYRGQDFPDPGDNLLYQLVSVQDIDSVTQSIDPADTLSLQSRGFVEKALKSVTAMQSYQFLSQVKWTDDLNANDHFVRLTGVLNATDGVLTASDISTINAAWFTGPEGISSGLMWPEIKLQFRFDVSTTGKAAGIILCGKDKDNYWYLKATGSQLALVERVGGVDQSPVATYSATFNADTWYWLRITYVGGVFNIWHKPDGQSWWSWDGGYTHATDNLPAFGRDQGLVGLRADLTADTISFRNLFAWNEETDKNTDWLIREIGTLAGVINYLPNDYFSANGALAGGSWWDSTVRSDFDIEFDLPVLGDGESVAIYTRWTVGTGGNYTYISRSGSEISITFAYVAGPSETHIEIVTVDRANTGTIRCRVVTHGKWLTVYFSNRPVANFYDYLSNYETGESGIDNGTASNAPNVLVRELNDWRDTFIIDMGQALGEALAGALDGRFVRYFAEGDALRYSRFETRDDLGTWENFVMTDNFGANDVDHVALVRATGVEIIEKINHQRAKEHGLLFAQVQNTTARTVDRMSADTELQLAFANQLLVIHNISMRARMEVQLEDKVNIKWTSTDLKAAVNENCIVHGYNYIMRQAALDMQLVLRKRM